jgi:signal transduction histidine kinase
MVLRAGYGAVLAVLVISAVEAYRIQSGVSREHLEIYRSYARQEQIHTVLRRNLWLAGNYVRDFFIKTTPQEANGLAAQLSALQNEDETALAGLPGDAAGVAQLHRSIDEFWAVLEPVPHTMLHATGDQKFDFLQRVVVPRRGELYTALLALTDADNRKLQEGLTEFNDTRKRASWRLLTMLGIGVLLSLAVARFSLRHAEHLERQAERQYAETEHAKGELKRLSARLLEMEEEGKRQLSRELHDEIGQSLALLQIEISNALAMARRGSAPGDDGILRERLSRARELAERTVQTVRNISLLLRPALLDDLGLTPALQFQLEDFLRRSGIACDFVEEGVADDLPDHIKTCVYRVVQETLHNCEKHAQASRVRVTVRQSGDCLFVEVEDNGRGFIYSDQALASGNPGLGLLGMRERASIAGGSLAVDSAPGRGTRIALRLPLAAQANASSQPSPIGKEISA